MGTNAWGTVASRAPLVLTMGDPCGIGPEIIAKAFHDGAVHGPAVVLGDVGVMRRAAGVVGDGRLAVAVLTQAADVAACPPNCIPVLPVVGLAEGLAELPWGRIDARAGAAAAACIAEAVRQVQAGHARAVVTAPV